jgi:hypothetical protein
MESPCEYDVALPGSISHGGSYLIIVTISNELCLFIDLFRSHLEAFEELSLFSDVILIRFHS